MSLADEPVPSQAMDPTRILGARSQSRNRCVTQTKEENNTVIFKLTNSKSIWLNTIIGFAFGVYLMGCEGSDEAQRRLPTPQDMLTPEDSGETPSVRDADITDASNSVDAQMDAGSLPPDPLGTLGDFELQIGVGNWVTVFGAVPGITQLW